MAFLASMEIPLVEFFSYKNQILLLLMPVRISGPEFLYKAFDFIKIEYIGAKICKDGPKVNVALSLLSVYKVQIVFLSFMYNIFCTNNFFFGCLNSNYNFLSFYFCIVVIK